MKILYVLHIPSHSHSFLKLPLPPRHTHMYVTNKCNFFISCKF